MVDYHPHDISTTSVCQDIFMNRCPELDTDDRIALLNILHREIPDEAEVARKITELSVFRSYHTLSKRLTESCSNEAIRDRASHATDADPPGAADGKKFLLRDPKHILKLNSCIITSIIFFCLHNSPFRYIKFTKG